VLKRLARRAVEGARGFTLWDIATMRPTDPTSEHFRAQKLQQLRQQLAETTDHLQRKEILRQIEEIEEESENKFKP